MEVFEDPGFIEGLRAVGYVSLAFWIIDAWHSQCLEALWAEDVGTVGKLELREAFGPRKCRASSQGFNHTA